MIELIPWEPASSVSRQPSLWLGLADSPFGQCQCIWSAHGIASLQWPDPPQASPDHSLAPSHLDLRLARRDDIQAARFLSEIFKQSPETTTDFQLWIRGTRFQFDVWRALLKIPFGATTNYGAVAAAVGRPNAARAVGSAIAANPVAFLIPCHRVLPRSQPPGHFRWGTKRKAEILCWEQSSFPGSEPSEILNPDFSAAKRCVMSSPVNTKCADVS